MTNIDSRSLRAAILDGDEIAVLDVREQGEFGACHLFHAVNAPLSRIEIEVPRLVPRRATRVVVVSGGMSGLAERGARVLSGLGYSDITTHDDAPEDWEAAGFTLYSGINVPSKAFGEAIEHHFGTPSIDAQGLKAMQDRGDDLVILDSRTFAEYRNMNIPGGISVPGGELAYRVQDFAPSPETTVVVNCAGRTRSIVGAQSVINSGIPNRVVALENGTMGWHLAGLELEHGRTDRYPDGSPQSLDAALAMRDRVIRDYGIRTINRDMLAQWQDEADRHTLYLLDVRDPAEFAAGHLPGARSAPGGQLVQATDFQIGVPQGRIVLTDDYGVRAAMTAHWLVQMGFPQVYVLTDGLTGVSDGLEQGTESWSLADRGPEIGVEELSRSLDDGNTFVLDLGESRVYRTAHIPGAGWAVRSRIAETGPELPATERLVLTSADSHLAHLAVSEAQALTDADVLVLAGGTNAWQAAGYPVDADRYSPPDEACIDVYLRAYDRNTDVEKKMQEYIDWEVALIEQIEKDPDVNFRPGAATVSV